MLNFESLAQLDNPTAVKESLKTLPNTYNQIYEVNIKRIENQDQTSRERAFQVMSWLSYALSPLTVKALQHGLSVKLGDAELRKDALPDDDSLVSVCANLVAIDSKTEVIRLAHETTQDYLKKIRSNKFPQGHSIISSACLAYLSLGEFSDLCISRTKIAARLKQYPLYRYAVEYWPQHVILGDLELNSQGSIIDFLGSRQHYSADEVVANHRRSAWGAENGGPWTDWNRLSTQRRDSPLHAVATYGLWKTVNFLLREKGHKVDQLNNFGETALHRAAQVGQATMMEELICHGADINAKVQQHYLGQATPMILASNCLQVDAVRVLLNYGVDVNQFDPQNGLIPLHFAASMSTELTRLLLDYGANPNLPAYRPPVFPERGPMTSLHFSVYFSHEFEGALERIKLLIERGAYINTQTGLGNTALHLAILGEHQDLIHLLLQKGADIYLKNKQEKSAVQLAQERGQFSWIKEVIPCQVLDDRLQKTSALHQAIWAKDHPRIRNLLEQGSEIMEEDENGKTPWDYCVMSADVKLADILLDHMDYNGLPKDIASAAFDTAIAQMTAFDYTDTKTWESTVQICRRLLPFRKAFSNEFEFAKARSPISNYNKTFLIWAAWLGRTSEVKFLLECGSDVDAQDVYLDTATHHAVIGNHLEIVKLLVENGANLGLQNRHNKTPLMEAEASGHTDIKAYLEDVRAN